MRISHLPFLKMVRGVGLEPTYLTAYAPQTYVSTNFTTRAYRSAMLVVRHREILLSSVAPVGQHSFSKKYSGRSTVTTRAKKRPKENEIIAIFIVCVKSGIILILPLE